MLARHAIKFLNSSFQKSDPRVRGQTISEVLDIFVIVMHSCMCVQYLVPVVLHSQQVAAGLLQACCLAVIELISECVHIACSGLMRTSLLQVVNRLDSN